MSKDTDKRTNLRAANYFTQNGTSKLTPSQRKRALKKDRTMKAREAK